jgi:phage tail-like protein
VSNFLKVDGKYLYDNRLPRVYKRDDAVQKPSPFPLKRYLQVTDVGYQYINDKTDGLFNMYNPDLCPPEFLPYLASMLGFEFPFEMTEREQRQWLKLLPTLYESKGTKNLFRYLGRVVYGKDTDVSAERFPMILNAGVVEEPNTIELRVQVNGDIFDLDKRTDNFRSFAEKFRPVNHRLDVLIALFYADEYEKSRLADNSEFHFLQESTTDLYDKAKIIEAYDFYKLKYVEEDVYDSSQIYESYDINRTSDDDEYLVQPIEREEITVLKHYESDNYDNTKITESSTERLLNYESDSYNGISAEEEVTPKVLFYDTDTYDGVDGDESQDVATIYGATLNSKIALLGGFQLNKKIEVVTYPTLP